MASEYLSKGSLILVEGRLKLDTWKPMMARSGPSGVICERMQMLGGRGEGGGGGGGGRMQGGGGRMAPRARRIPDYNQAGPP